mmetsp:Transcript_26334/g.77291  ORF Transcript_26334/g.77291 Transcript_26334/m.77291 type:complete len:212 (+) Transcript_26334:758-1393(+)
MEDASILTLVVEEVSRVPGRLWDLNMRPIHSIDAPWETTLLIEAVRCGAHLHTLRKVDEIFIQRTHCVHKAVDNRGHLGALPEAPGERDSLLAFQGSEEVHGHAHLLAHGQVRETPPPAPLLLPRKAGRAVHVTVMWSWQEDANEHVNHAGGAPHLRPKALVRHVWAVIHGEAVCRGRARVPAAVASSRALTLGREMKILHPPKRLVTLHE